MFFLLQSKASQTTEALHGCHALFPCDHGVMPAMLANGSVSHCCIFILHIGGRKIKVTESLVHQQHGCTWLALSSAPLVSMCVTLTHPPSRLHQIYLVFLSPQAHTYSPTCHLYHPTSALSYLLGKKVCSGGCHKSFNWKAAHVVHL